MQTGTIVCLVALVWTLVEGRREITSKSSSVQSPKDLRRAIFKNYDSKVIPILAAGDIVPVNISFTPIYIRELDEEKEILIIDGWLTLFWLDETLKWDPAAYGGIESLNLPSEDFWIPDMSSYMTSPDAKLFPTISTKVILFSTGYVMWVPPMTLSTQCPLSHRHFPHDQQTCQLKFGSWTYGSKQINLQLRSNKIDLTNFKDNNPEWKLKSVSLTKEDKIYDCCPDEIYSSANVNITLTRRCPSTVYIADTVSLFAVTLSFLMFFLPTASVQKVMLGTLAEVLMGISALYLGTVIKAPAAKFIASTHIYYYMKLTGVFILAEVIVINIARISAPCRPPRWLLSICQSLCQPFAICSSTDEKDKKNSLSQKEEWTLVATTVDRLFLIASIATTVLFYKLR